MARRTPAEEHRPVPADAPQVQVTIPGVGVCVGALLDRTPLGEALVDLGPPHGRRWVPADWCPGA